MKSFSRSLSGRKTRTGPGRRARLLAAFERSGMSAAAFARRHRLNYTTFCGWRQRRASAKAAPAFVQVQLPPAASPTALLIELGGQVRLRIHCADQIDLAARLLRALNAIASC